MTRIGRLFDCLKRDGRKGLIAYLTAGDPSPARTPALVEALVRGGADLIELGVPFSDPIADGPVIQRAGERALKAGTTLTGAGNCAADPAELRSSATAVHLLEPGGALRPRSAGSGCRGLRHRWLPAHRCQRGRGARLCGRHAPPRPGYRFSGAPTSTPRRLNWWRATPPVSCIWFRARASPASANACPPPFAR